MKILFFLFSLNFMFAQSDIYKIEVKDIDGNIFKMEKFKGKTILIVNTASKCGYTPQYEGLEKLFINYKDKNFVILGFPSNDFLWQEPASEREIKEFCTLNYGVTFPMFSKIEVWGKGQHPLYKFLSEKNSNPKFYGKINWNFNKFLIDKNGKIINRFGSKVEPLSKEITEAIETIL